MLTNGKLNMGDWLHMVDALHAARQADQKMRLPAPNGGKWATTVHKDHMESLVPKMMPDFRPTHFFNGKDSLNGLDDGHPFVGVPVMFAETIHGCKAGMTALVVAHMPAIKEQVDAGAFAHEMNGDAYEKFFKEQNWCVGDYVLLEVRLEDDLTPITNQPANLDHGMLPQYHEELKNRVEDYILAGNDAAKERLMHIIDHMVRVLDDIWGVGMPTHAGSESAGQYVARALKGK